MSHEQLWAPWRLAYLKPDLAAAPAPKPLQLLPGGDADCFLCRNVVDDADRANHVVERIEATITVLNRYPYNNGHLLIAPHRHVGRLDQLTAAEQAGSLETMNRMVALLERTMGPEGFNVGLNLGRVAGAGVPGHLHWHIVPRWAGDVNFMPALAGIKVIPQSLDALWELLTTALATTSD
ncbi:MAG: HIT domain-containing protein [Pirellulales bacterium]|nr:HIT domain-containing protein [Pirellulales bacterium]